MASDKCGSTFPHVWPSNRGRPQSYRRYNLCSYSNMITQLSYTNVTTCWPLSRCNVICATVHKISAIHMHWSRRSFSTKNTKKSYLFFTAKAAPKSLSVALVRDESLAIFSAVEVNAGWRDVKSTYIKTTLDNALPPSLQDFFST